MSGNTRFLWGRTKAPEVVGVKSLTLAPQSSAPDAEEGILYMDASGNLKFCADGTNYVTVDVT